MIHMLLSQTKAMFRFISALYAPVLVTLVALAVYGVRTDTPSGVLTRDPAVIMNVSPFYGTLSKLGMLLWCGCGTICLFSASLLRRESHNVETRAFLISSGILTFALLLDDLFMVHEYVAPTMLHLPETVIYAAHAMALFLICIWFRRIIVGTRFALLFFAIGFFGLSISVDMLPLDKLHGRFLIEDGFKMLGIASWFGYYADTCFQQLRTNLAHETEDPEQTAPIGRLRGTAERL
jgi:hypothetical protein